MPQSPKLQLASFVIICGQMDAYWKKISALYSAALIWQKTMDFGNTCSCNISLENTLVMQIKDTKVQDISEILCKELVV